MPLFQRKPNAVTARAYAALTPVLRASGRGADGRAAFDALLLTVDLFDDIKVERCREVIVTATNAAGITSGGVLPYRNAMRIAAERYRARTGRGARIHCYRHIPENAGLFEAEAAAAAVLDALERLYGEVASEETRAMAASIGKLVPYFLKGGLARANSQSGHIEPLPLGKALNFVIAVPHAGTAAETSRLQSSASRSAADAGEEASNQQSGAPDTAVRARVQIQNLQNGTPLSVISTPMPGEAVAALARGDLAMLAPHLSNAFEADAARPTLVVSALTERLIALGACGAALTGRKNAVFGLFSSEAEAKTAADAMRSCAECAFVTAVKSV